MAGPAPAQVRLDKQVNSFTVSSPNWRLTYGTAPSGGDIMFLESSGRVWLAHGTWLRLIDAKSGNVVRRWHLDSPILKLAETKSGVNATIGEPSGARFINGPERTVVPVDAGQDSNPRFIPEYWGIALQSRQEAEALFFPPFFDPPAEYRLPAEKAAAALSQLKSLLEHDATSPWLRIIQGRLRRDQGDTGYRASFHAALEIISTDYTELLPISAYLEKLNETDFADRSWERGMRDYLARGCDPRVAFEGSLGYAGLRFYQPFRMNRPQVLRPQVYDRLYLIDPGGGPDGLLWRILADFYEQSGDRARASLWRERAERQSALNAWPRGIHTLKDIDQAALWVAAIVLACFLFLLSRHLRYGPDLYSDDDVPEYEFFGLSRLQFWPWSDRLLFLLLVVGAWLLTGYGGVRFEGRVRIWQAPISIATGSLAGASSERYLSGLRESPERELLLAMSRQQSGKLEEAVKPYRLLQQFPESANNLGVILHDRGDVAAAQAAFVRAGDLPEARFNRTGEAANEWTQQWKENLPGKGKKMPAPPSPAEWSDALAGPFTWDRMLLGPLAWLSQESRANQVFSRYSFERGAMRADLVISLGLLAFAVILNLLPHRRAVKVPPSGNRWLELLFPGTSPRWSVIGPVFLAAWCFLLLQILARLVMGTPYFLTGEWTPIYAAKWLGIPVETLPSPYIYLRPSAMWMYGAPTLLFVVNAAVVRWRRKT